MGRHAQRMNERAYSLQILYQAEILETEPMKLVEEGRLAAETKALGEYGKGLLAGVTENKAMLDRRIERASQHWALDRMPAVDRSLLRMTAYEMIHVDDVPVSVSINEAVNLAKQFGGDDSPRFVNGILGRIAIQLEEEQAAAAPAEQAPVQEPEEAPVAADDDVITEEAAVAAVLEAIAAKDAE